MLCSGGELSRGCDVPNVHWLKATLSEQAVGFSSHGVACSQLA